MTKRYQPTKRCEAVITYANPWNLGGTHLEQRQCHKKPRYIITQKSDKQKMCLCAGCKDVFKKRNKGELDLYRIVPVIQSRGTKP